MESDSMSLMFVIAIAAIIIFVIYWYLTTNLDGARAVPTGASAYEFHRASQIEARAETTGAWAYEFHRASQIEVIEWHKSDELYRAFEKFHDNHAREPREEISKAMKIHDKFMTEIRNHFQRRGICQQLEYTGSSYEGVKVKKNNEDYGLEFDVMMIIDKHKYELEAVNYIFKPGYVWLKFIGNRMPEPGRKRVRDSWDFFGHVTYDGYVDPVETANIFRGELQMAINKSATMNGRVKLREHGPAVQMDIYEDPWTSYYRSTPLYSVDVVPTYEVGADLFVAKPIKGEEIVGLSTTIWRRSYSIQEKEKLKGEAKNVLRVLKVIRNREPNLAPLTSYHLKTAIFYEMDAETDWSRRAWVLRFFGVLKRLEESLLSGNLKHYFIKDKDMNILSHIDIPAPCLFNMHNRINRLRTDKNTILKILNS